MPPGVYRCEELESEILLPRNPIGRPGTNGNRAGRKQVFLGYLDAGKMNPRLKNLETALVDGNQWKSSSLKTRFSEESRCGEHECRVLIPRNPIGRPKTDGNRAGREQAFLNNLDAENTNPGPKHIETTVVVQEYCLRL